MRFSSTVDVERPTRARCGRQLKNASLLSHRSESRFRRRRRDAAAAALEKAKEEYKDAEKACKDDDNDDKGGN